MGIHGQGVVEHDPGLNATVGENQVSWADGRADLVVHALTVQPAL
ncbi:MAG: hypothetical protein QOJ44_2276 [Acidimicrobiaceae bacterium]|jgi:hypothetical protein|nr:hypothetical protein [Acidimicrobiaceae bacterium]